jgi:hypothetical protein
MFWKKTPVPLYEYWLQGVLRLKEEADGSRIAHSAIYRKFTDKSVVESSRKTSGSPGHLGWDSSL